MLVGKADKAAVAPPDWAINFKKWRREVLVIVNANFYVKSGYCAG